MDPIPLGILLGIGFAAVATGPMLSMTWETRREKFEAIAGSIALRFITGVAITTIDLDTVRWMTGLVVGVAISVPSAIVTRMYLPILSVGAIGGLVVGALAQIFL